MVLSSATTPGQAGVGSNGNEGVLRIPQSPSISGTLLSDCLVSYPGHSLGEVIPLCRGAVSVFYSLSRQGNGQLIYMICKHKSTKLNGYKYCYVSLTIQLNISNLLTNMLNRTVWII